MIEKKYVELINREIDGANSKAESAKLKSYLAKNKEARRLFQELSKTTSALKAIRQVEPPPHLARHILNLIERPERGRTREGGILQRIVESLRAPSVPRYALVFVSGACVGILLFVALTQAPRFSEERSPELTGAVVPPPELSRLQGIDSVSIDRVEVTGKLRTLAMRDQLLADLDIDSKESIRIELSFESLELQFLGFWRRAGEVGILDVGLDRVVVTHSGANHYALSFAQKVVPQQPIRANIYAGRTLLFASTLRISESSVSR